MKFRLLILTTLSLLVAAFLAGVVWVSDRVLEREARADLADDLERSAVVFDELADLRSATLASALHVTAEEPRLKAVVATDEIEHTTVLDVAQELRTVMGSELFLMVDGGGRLMADTAAPAEHGASLAAVPLVASTLAGGASEAVWIADDRAYQVAGRRMAFGDEVVGAVIAGRAIDERVAESIARQSGSAVLILLDGRPLAAAGAERATLDELAAALVATDGPELALGEARWIAVRRPLPGYAGDRELSYALVRSLDRALAPSRELTRRFAQLAGIALATAIVLALLLSSWLSRPLDRLVGFTRSIAAGRLEVRAPVRGPTEVRALARALNEMGEQLASSRSELEQLNASLEHTVDERTRHLREANHEIGEMLDNLDDAVLIVGRDLRIEPRCSPGCARLFGTDAIAGRDLRELLFAHGRIEVDAEALAMHTFVLDNTFGESELQWELNGHLLLREVAFRHPAAPHERTLTIRYAPLFDDEGAIVRVLLVVSDVTELLALRRGMALEQRRSDARIEAMLAFVRCGRLDALQFVDESCARIPRVMQGIERWAEHREREELVAVLRELHTLKGNARALRLREISSRTHELEGAVQCLLAPGADASATDEIAELRPAVRELEERVAVCAEVADELLRKNGDRAHVDVPRMQSWLGALATKGQSEPRLAAMRSLLAAQADESVTGVARLLEQQRAMIDEVGAQLGKTVRLELAAGDELYVAPATAAALRDAFVHAIRNAIDHGIETPAERLAAGKPAVGVLSLRWQRHSDAWLLRLTDDGRGVDSEAIVAVARRRGLVGEHEHPTVADVHELLFTPTLSSKAVADDISGRGIGLDAMRTGLRKCGISVELRSAAGRGTTLELRLPVGAVCFEERAGVPTMDGEEAIAA